MSTTTPRTPSPDFAQSGCVASSPRTDKPASHITAANKGKAKILHLTRLFFEQTDADHGLTMPQIIEKLEESGISAERRAIYRDIDALRSFGLDIQTLARRPVEYALVSRQFTKAELMLMTDAVQSSRFLTKRKSDDLVRSIGKLASSHDAASLRKRVHVEGRIKMLNESVFHNVDIIQEAIRTRMKISFRYFKYDVDKHEKMQHDGKPYRETPLALVYSNEYYYVVTYNDKHASFVHYRVDRMRSLMCTEERATSNEMTRDFDVNEHTSCAFGMYGGTRHVVTLLVHESAMSGIVDRFGKDVAVLRVAASEEKRMARAESGAWARVSVPVMESPAFFGWLLTFGTRVRIEKPASLRESYARYLADTLAVYAESAHASCT